MRRTALLAVPIMFALALAGCGKSNDTSSTTSAANSSSATTTTSGAASSASTMATVKLSDSKFGQILTDTQGNTLYVFEKDTGTTSNCNTGCEELWPPMKVTGTPVAGSGITQSDLGTTTRADGSTQLTFHGHPVYHYAPDTKAGDTNGQGIGGIWFVVDSSGNPVKSAASSTPTTMASPTTQASSSGY
jgi:predicted lipoprotein with Yx(FWY)xxD motif